MGQVVGMDTDIISEAQAYCRKAGIELSTLGVRALNSSRFFDRLERKRQQADEATARLRKFMADNPPSGDAA